MTHLELRKNFLDFLKNKGHKIVPSSSLIPDDPSVLFTTAGMQQFKRYYTGELDAKKDFGSQRTAAIQKCFRTSDMEEIGDKTHLTFFEMLGNFSFGPVGTDEPDNKEISGYFKRPSIFWAYEFIVGVLGINPERLTISVFEGDKETPFDRHSYDIWLDEIKIPESKIIKSSRTDNFWGPTGNEGPCGPTTEIYVDGVEIWNLVFNEYYREKTGEYRKLENPGVDTGMGLERLLAMLQGVDSVFETDVLKPLMDKVGEWAPEVDVKIKRILVDHLRSSIFAVADGVRPSNKEAGYVLRRLLRRILAYQIKCDIHADLFAETVPVVKKIYSGIYPELENEKEISAVLEEERIKFQEAIGKGIKEIESAGWRDRKISGADAFYLYETFGLPFELVKELAPKQAIENLKKEDFDYEFKKHQEVSRAGVEKKFGGHGLVLDTGELKAGNKEELEKATRLHTATHLLQWALREVLGKEVKQMGSDINPERLRFDFSFSRKMSAEEIKKTEILVNEKIKENLAVFFKEMPKEEAEKTGALSFFRQKYPDIVKVYFIGSEKNPLSKEFCGGPHAQSTADIGVFKILKEESVSAGVRRIKAIVE